MRQKKKPNLEAIAQELGRAIAERRKKKRLTQEELSELVEVDPMTVSRMERGSTTPSLERLVMIAWALDCGIGELLASTSPLTGDRVQKVAAAMQALEPRDQQLLAEFAELLSRPRAG